MDLWTGPLARASRLSAKGAHLWMAGWTTLRVAHAPTHRPSAAHKLHRAQPLRVERSKTNKTKPFDSHRHQAHIHGHQEVLNTLKSTPSLQSNPRNPALDLNRSRSRNHRSRSPKYAATTHRGPSGPDGGLHQGQFSSVAHGLQHWPPGRAVMVQPSVAELIAYPTLLLAVGVALAGCRMGQPIHSE